MCLFTCAATRAVYLELTPDLNAEMFLLAFMTILFIDSCTVATLLSVETLHVCRVGHCNSVITERLYAMMISMQRVI